MYKRAGMWYDCANAIPTKGETMSVNEDLAYVAWQDDAFEAFEAEHAEALDAEAYEAWASDARDDGEDDSRDAYDAYLERMLPDD